MLTPGRPTAGEARRSALAGLAALLLLLCVLSGCLVTGNAVRFQPLKYGYAWPARSSLHPQDADLVAPDQQASDILAQWKETYKSEATCGMVLKTDLTPAFQQFDNKAVDGLLAQREPLTVEGQTYSRFGAATVMVNGQELNPPQKPGFSTKLDTSKPLEVIVVQGYISDDQKSEGLLRLYYTTGDQDPQGQALPAWSGALYLLRLAK
jgi:hypothetical protein